jgi:flagellar biosynthesis chaperone FliJ
MADAENSMTLNQNYAKASSAVPAFELVDYRSSKLYGSAEYTDVITVDTESVYTAPTAVNEESLYTAPEAGARQSLYTAPEAGGLYTIPEAANSIDRHGVQKAKSEGNQKKLCVLAILICIVVILLIAGAFVFLFLQVYDLRSKMASSEQLLLQQINGSLSSVEENLKMASSLQSEDAEELGASVQDISDHLVSQIVSNLSEQLATSIENITEQLAQQSSEFLAFRETLSGLHQSHPASSCAALRPSSLSGYYWVRASNGSAVRVYCDMTRLCGNITGGWMRVAELDMTNSSHQCPSGLRQHNYPGARTCVRSTSVRGCSSVTISSATVEYSRVCGKIIAYQVGTPEPFFVFLGQGIINSYYVNGISLTHGNPRQHIWTFGAGTDEINTSELSCPCFNASRVKGPPAFVGNDYFCDTGSDERYNPGTFYGNDPLWDGAGCGPQNGCCSFNNPPWFFKQLPQLTTDDIEMRVCRDQDASNEDIAVESVEIYVA